MIDVNRSVPGAHHLDQLEAIKHKSIQFHAFTQEVAKAIVGQEHAIHFILIALLCDGHILLEGVPGVAKTTMIKAITRALGLQCSRIQFTPDLLPSDLIGTMIYDQKTQNFETKKGPIFANMILADEINRAPAKVQSALLEAMQERQVTIGSQTFELDAPFFVFATQNPVEQEGTYRLPEAQIDRFMFKIHVGYPKLHEERLIMQRRPDVEAVLNVISKEHIQESQNLVKTIYLDDKVADYILNIVFATRDPEKYNLAELSSFIECGVSPRATLALAHAARANAFLKQRHFVIPEDVKMVAEEVLAHRLTLTYSAEAQGIDQKNVVKKILKAIPTP